ncbi:thioredoxin TrxC [Lysobacter sp. A03]|uniref:thioredoxin TrxC n=1 Tax=Lysobacter sp. A03 TaxID=1199154 RepID=UPI0005B6B173|nr:thioredoxin TrxC [Lysobacter sp. A03]KIQ97768.1 Thioredoxin [Lysobacter sp. A03]
MSSSTTGNAAEAVLVVCPHCHSPNRVPDARLAEAPSCGRCQKALFDGKPVSLGVDHFAAHISRGGLPVLVDFWAPWCGPCKVMAPQFELAAAELEPYVRLAKVDTQSEPTLAQQYAIRSIPTLALFKGGRELARQAGAMSAADIVRWTRQHLPE